jgi:hypothetical protein
MLGLQAAQNSKAVCVHTKPPSFHLTSLETVLKLLWRKWRFQTITPAYCEVDYLRPFNEEHQHVKRKHVDVVVWFVTCKAKTSSKTFWERSPFQQRKRHNHNLNIVILTLDFWMISMRNHWLKGTWALSSRSQTVMTSRFFSLISCRFSWASLSETYEMEILN